MIAPHRTSCTWLIHAQDYTCGLPGRTARLVRQGKKAFYRPDRPAYRLLQANYSHVSWGVRAKTCVLRLQLSLFYLKIPDNDPLIDLTQSVNSSLSIVVEWSPLSILFFIVIRKFTLFPIENSRIWPIQSQNMTAVLLTFYSFRNYLVLFKLLLLLSVLQLFILSFQVLAVTWKTSWEKERYEICFV